jgi:hypothetical protein
MSATRVDLLNKCGSCIYASPEKRNPSRIICSKMSPQNNSFQRSRIACRIYKRDKTQYELKKIRTEKSMMISQLNGKCWCCSKAHRILNRGAYSCDYLKERGVIARGGNGKCDMWEWRGVQKEET